MNELRQDERNVNDGDAKEDGRTVNGTSEELGNLNETREEAGNVNDFRAGLVEGQRRPDVLISTRLNK